MPYGEEESPIIVVAIDAIDTVGSHFDHGELLRELTRQRVREVRRRDGRTRGFVASEEEMTRSEFGVEGSHNLEELETVRTKTKRGENGD